MYLYYSLFTDLPSNLQMFTADLSDIFPGGITDTKYISDYIAKEPVSFLSYLFKKYQREEKRRLTNLENHDPATQQKSPKKCFRLDVQPPLPIEQLEPAALKSKENGQQADIVTSQSKSRRKRRRNKSLSVQDEKPYCEQYAVSCE